MALQTNNPRLERICEKYEIGTPISCENLGGDENHNLCLTTSSGKYVVRRIGSKLTPRKRGLIDLEFRTLNGLNDRGFPYQVPTPILNRDGSYIDEIASRPYWVYPFLEGNKEGQKKASVEEISAALAKYHDVVSKIKIPNLPLEPLFGPLWLQENYREMKRHDPRSELDEVMRTYVDFFGDIYSETSQNRCDEEVLATHGDFSKDNLLFTPQGKVRGIIDFDDIQVAPRIRDVANAALYSCFDGRKFNPTRLNEFLQAYKPKLGLKDEERKLVIPAMLREFCSIFSWYYVAPKKSEKERISGMQETYEKTKSLLEVN